jgi:hypothetical protein
MSIIDSLTRLRQATIERYQAQVYRVFVNGLEITYGGRSPTIYNAGTEDLVIIPNYEFGQRAWRASIPFLSQNADQVRLDAAWVLRGKANHNIACRAASINIANVGNVFEVILVEKTVGVTNG